MFYWGEPERAPPRALQRLRSPSHNDGNWGEPERAPPRALQRLRSLSHNDNGGGGGISYVLPNAHARSLRGQVQRSVEAEQDKEQARLSRTGETKEVLLRF